ncbi:MAG: zinc ribbon domain-containing protein [Pirellulales bacterium]
MVTSSDDWTDEDGWSADDHSMAADTLPCPECGEEIYEEAERCPYCGTYVIFHSSVWAGRSTAWIVLGLVGVVAVVVALVLFV